MSKAGIQWDTWHDLRHILASRWAMTGPNEGTIAALLRHSTTALVKRYSNLSPSHLKAAVEGVVGFGKVPAGHQAETGGTDKSEPASNETVTGTVTTGSAGERSNVEAAVKWSRRSGLNGRPAVYEFPLTLPQTT